MTNKEYADRLMGIRIAVNELCDDLGATYETRREILEKVLNNALFGDLSRVKRGKVPTDKAITVEDYTSIDFFMKRSVLM